MTNNLDNPIAPVANPLPSSTMQMNMGEPNGLNEAKKQGQTIKIVLLLIIFLILGVLLAYILMKYVRGEKDQVTVTTTVIPTSVATIAQREPSLMPTNSENGLVEFSFPVVIPVLENPYVVSGKALESAEVIPVVTDEESSIIVSGVGYELNIRTFYESEATSYEEYFFLKKVGNDTIARVKTDFFEEDGDIYTYVKGDSVNEINDCPGMGPELLPAPCGPSRYVSGNEVETFYILDITCDADAEIVSKCDDIVKTLDVLY
jgi:hypothetical protein